jgi:Spy/CpxP family protein refolding chaperone
MKAFSRLIVTTTALAASALAQPAPPDPATMAQNRVTHLTSQLSLTSSQASQASSIYTNAATAITPLQATMKSYRSTLQAAVKSGAMDTIDQTAASIGATMGQITAIQSKADAAFYATLTASQQATLNATPGGFGAPGPGGPGQGGPPPGPPPDNGGQ